ncbi:MAG: primase-helicase family protein, partial [Alphaproteobacteria bacterium]
GSRHETHVKLTGWLAFKTLRNPISSQAIEMLFTESITTMQLADPGFDSIDLVIGGYETAVDKAVEHKAEANQYEQNKAASKLHLTLWTAEDVQLCAEKQECEAEQVVFLVQRNNAYYVLQRDSSYEGPFSERDMQVELFQKLAASPVKLYEQSGEGYRPRTLTDIARDYGEVAQKMCVDMSAAATTYHRPSRTIYEISAPLIDHEPTFHEPIAHWLKLFSGPDATHEKVLNWLACCPDLNKMLCALTIVAEPGTGKTLFAQGIASLWEKNGATSSVEAMLDKFNEALVQCPVVFADEALPKVWKWDNVTTKLRAEIATVVRSLNRKYFAPTPLVGSLRFILATNNPMILASNVSTRADLDAIAQRFLYVEPKKVAEEFLMTLTFAEKNAWRTHKIAQHVRWLARERQVEPEGRFWVTGDITKMHRLLTTSSDWNSWICEWIVAGLLDNFGKLAMKPETCGRVQLVNGRLYVNTTAISAGWAAYTNYPTVNPDPRRVAAALRALAKSPTTVQLRPTRFRYFEIDLEYVVAWAEQQGACGKDEIDRAMAQEQNQGPSLVVLDDKRKDKDKD